MKWKEFFARLRGRQKTYIYINGEEVPLCDIFVNSVPQVGETISLWNGSYFRYYTVVRRIYGINTPTKTGCWNIYVILLPCETYTD